MNVIEEEPIVRTTTQARGASRRRMNLRVLVGSMLLAVIAGFVVYAAFYNDELPGRNLTSGVQSVPPAP